jgi:probable O-glycosylation ligase (exosortase A-associated)
VKGLILIYLIAASGTVGAIFNPVIGLFVYVGFAVLRPQFIWGFAGDFSGISLYVGIATLVGWAFRGFGTFQLGRGKSIVISLALFALWAAISATQAVDREVAYNEMMPMLKYVVPFLIGVTLLNTEQLSRGMFWVIVGCQGWVGLEMNQTYLMKGYNVAGDGFGGMDNNCFGVALVSTIGPAVALALGAKKWYEKAFAIAAVLLILHTTLLTFSRGALVGLALVGLTAFIIMPKRPKHIGALVLIVLIAARLTGPQLMARYATIAVEEEDRDASAESRLDLWKDCLKVMWQNPVFGVGPGNFRVVAADLGWSPGKQAHSTWMQTAAENGAPGVALLLCFFLLTLVKVWPLARQKQTEENRYQVVMASGIVMCLVGFIVTGQFVSLGGLEIPYYVAMIGVILLKTQPASAPAVAEAAPRPAMPERSGSLAMARPVQQSPARTS